MSDDRWYVAHMRCGVCGDERSNAYVLYEVGMEQYLCLGMGKCAHCGAVFAHVCINTVPIVLMVCAADYGPQPVPVITADEAERLKREIREM